MAKPRTGCQASSKESSQCGPERGFGAWGSSGATGTAGVASDRPLEKRGGGNSRSSHHGFRNSSGSLDHVRRDPPRLGRMYAGRGAAY